MYPYTSLRMDVKILKGDGKREKEKIRLADRYLAGVIKYITYYEIRKTAAC